MTVTTAAKHETTSAPPAVLLQTRVWGLAPKNATAIGPEASVSSTLRWGSLSLLANTKPTPKSTGMIARSNGREVRTARKPVVTAVSPRGLTQKDGGKAKHQKGGTHW